MHKKSPASGRLNLATPAPAGLPEGECHQEPIAAGAGDADFPDKGSAGSSPRAGCKPSAGEATGCGSTSPQPCLLSWLASEMESWTTGKCKSEEENEVQRAQENRGSEKRTQPCTSPGLRCCPTARSAGLPE
ncbi:uncharacterized protein LOC144286807 [Canis aureus]